MNSRTSIRPLCLPLLVATLAIAGHAKAVDLYSAVTSIYQVSSGPTVKIGHVADASTAYNRLTAGGAYTVGCASDMMSPATGQRTLSTDNLVGGLRLVVTIPENLPALINMPGYYSLQRGATVFCTYNWTTHAVESGYTVGFGGISFHTGNGSRADGGTVAFVMRVPGMTDPDENGACIP